MRAEVYEERVHYTRFLLFLEVVVENAAWVQLHHLLCTVPQLPYLGSLCPELIVFCLISYGGLLYFVTCHHLSVRLLLNVRGREMETVVCLVPWCPPPTRWTSRHLYKWHESVWNICVLNKYVKCANIVGDAQWTFGTWNTKMLMFLNGEEEHPFFTWFLLCFILGSLTLGDPFLSPVPLWTYIGIFYFNVFIFTVSVASIFYKE